eukprot:872218-Rhodomonas_salina.1
MSAHIRQQRRSNSKQMEHCMLTAKTAARTIASIRSDILPQSRSIPVTRYETGSSVSPFFLPSVLNFTHAYDHFTKYFCLLSVFSPLILQVIEAFHQILKLFRNLTKSMMKIPRSCNGQQGSTNISAELNGKKQSMFPAPLHLSRSLALLCVIVFPTFAMEAASASTMDNGENVQCQCQSLRSLSPTRSTSLLTVLCPGCDGLRNVEARVPQPQIT